MLVDRHLVRLIEPFHQRDFLPALWISRETIGYVVDGSVLEFVLFLVIEDNTVVIDEIKDASFPKRATEEL